MHTVRSVLRSLVPFMAVLGIVLSPPAYSKIDSLAEAINKAGRQRMLTQRMLKSYSMVGLDVQSAGAKQQLHSAIRLFEKQLQELQAFAPTPEIKTSLDKVSKLWQPFRQQLKQPISRARAKAMLELNDQLLRAAHRVVLQLEDVSGTSYGRLVNISGRQRMLSQRLAKFYILRAWGVDTAEVRSATMQAKNEFRGALDELLAAKENTPAINQSLDDANTQWGLFKHALEREGDNFVPLIVAMTSENLLKTMDKITGMYVAVSK